MKLGFVVQRYGLDIAGGAEYHCRLVAEHLTRHAEVEVLTTCASDYVTWENHYPEGEEVLNGVRVRRFEVERPRDVYRFAEWSRRVEGPHTEDDERRWLEEEGPLSPRLVAEVALRRSAYDFLVFFSYRYYTTYHGLRAAPERAVLVPTAENDGIHRLSIFPPLFRLPRAIVWNSPEERDMIRADAHNDAVLGDVIGVGSKLPERLDPEGFRRNRGVTGPFLLYVGRIDRNKGCDELFPFFQRYRAETGSALRLVLVGKAVLDVPDDPAIVHLGFLPDQEKWDALAAAEALVIPSRYESLSMVTLEAWWAKRPVLANARCEVLLGQCRRSNGGLYYAHYDEFREALSLVEGDASLRRRLGENGRAYFDAHYAWDIVERKYLELFARLRAEDAARARAS
ncbi:MAG TPA: glycosyltransferase family 4 protein [Vicinamibacteria bacterium]|nr:glycosyltransferase family 4 protein [Vicinamibacteria bacterium]